MEEEDNRNTRDERTRKKITRTKAATAIKKIKNKKKGKVATTKNEKLMTSEIQDVKMMQLIVLMMMGRGGERKRR